jgi:hypothetical protein
MALVVNEFNRMSPISAAISKIKEGVSTVT